MRVLLLALVGLLAGSSAFGQDAVGDYRSNTVSGVWSAAASWQRCSVAGSPGTWVAAVTAPTAAASGVITIRSGHTITVSATANADQLTIASGGSIIVSSPRTLTIADGAGTDLTINGALTVNGTILVNGAAIANSGFGVGAGGNLTISGTGSSFNVNNANYSTSVSSNITVTSPGTFSSDASSNATISGNVNGTGTYTSLGLTTFSGNTNITNTGIKTFNDITVTGSVNASANNVSVNGNLLNNGNINCSAGTWALNGNLVNNGGISCSAGAWTFSGTSKSISTTGTPSQTDFFDLTIGNNAGITTSIPFNVGGNLIVTGTTGSLITNDFFSVAGSMTVNGSLNTAAGFDTQGALTISGASGLLTSNTVSFQTAGLLTVSGGSVLTANAGFDATAGITVTGASSVLTANNPFTVGGPLTVNTSGVFNASADGVISANFGGTGAFTSTALTTFDGNTTLSGAGSKTFNNVLVTGSLTTSGAATVNGNIDIADGATFAANNTLLVNGSTNVGAGTSGIISFAAAGTKTFVGLVTVNPGGTWNNTGNGAITFRGGITSNGTFTAGTGVQTFNTNAQILTGTFSIPSVTVTGVTLTNTNSLTVGTALSGTGGLTQGSGSTLNIGGTSGITTLTASAGGNTVNYTGATQTVKNVNYLNLGLSGSGAKTLQVGTTSIGGDLTLSGTASTTGVVGLTIVGKVDIGAGTTFTGGAFTHNVAGDWIQNGTFTSTGSTIDLNGAAQSISGSSVNFNNLTLAGTGIKAFNASAAIANALSISSGVVANLGSITTHTANSLLLAGSTAPSGTWGSTGSAAAQKNDTYFLSSSSGLITIATGTSTYYSRANGDWNNPTTWSTVGHGSAVNFGTFPTASSTVVIGGGFTVTLTGPEASTTVSFASGSSITNTLDLSGNTLTISGAVTIPQITTSGANILAVGAGTLNAASVGFTTGSAGGTGHRLTISTGTATVSGNVTGTGTSSTVQFTGAGTLQLAGTFFSPANGTLTPFVGSTVDYNGAAQAVQAHTYQNLRISGSGTKTAAAATTLNGNLIIGDGSTFAANNTLQVDGSTTVGGGTSGIISFATGGTKTFVGLVTVNAGGTWSNTANEAIAFRGGITNNGTFTAGTAVQTFNTNTQTLTGTFTIPSVTVTGVTLANTNSLTVGTVLAGTGGLTQGSGASLNIGGTSTITTLTATAGGNTVNYTGAAQTVKNVAYVNLGLSGSGAKTLQVGTTSIGGHLTLSGTVSATAVVGLTIGGNVDIGSGTTFTAGAFTHNVAGDWTQNGTFTNTGSTINLNGATQSIGGSSVNFNNLTLAGTGIKAFNASAAIANALSINSGVVANLGSITTHTANSLILAGSTASSGTWGSTGSAAAQQTDTYFLSSSSGLITIATGTFIYYSRANGDWNNPTTWSTVGHGSAVNFGTFPTASNTVIIGGGFTVTLTGPEASTSVSFASGSAITNTLDLSGNTLTVSGAVTIPQITTSGANILAVGAGTLNAASVGFTSGSAGGTGHRLTISTGTATVSGNLTGTGTSSTVQFTGAGTLHLGGTFFSPANGTLTPFAGSTVDYNASAAQAVQAHTYQNLRLSGNGTKTAAAATTLNGNLIIADGSTFTANNTLLVNGTTTVGGGTSGIISFATTSTKTFVGLVTISNGGTWNNTVNEAVTFRGGITNNGTFNAGTAVQTFNTNSQILTGTFTIPRVTVTGAAVALTNTNSLTVATALIGTGGLTQSSGATLNIGGTSTVTTFTATASTNTVNYTGSGQTVRPITYHHLTLSGSGTKTAAAAVTVNGNLTIGDGSTFTANNILQVMGSTAAGGGASGIISFGATGTKTFGGLVTVNTGGTWNNTLNALVIFHGGITNNGTFTAGTAVNTFDTNAQILTGTFTIPSVTVTGVSLTNTNTLTVNTALAGIGGTLTQGTGATLNIGGTNTIATLTASATSNTVNFTGAAQTVNSGTYVNLGLSGTGDKSFAGVTTIDGLSISNGTRADLGSNNHTAVSLTLAGTLQASGTWGSSSSPAVNQNNTFFAGTGLVTISSGSNTFYSRVNGDWNVNTTWSNIGFNGPAATGTPVLGSSVNIGGSRTVTVTANASCNTLSFATGTLSISNQTVTVSGNVTGTGAGSIVQFTGAGTLQLGGTFFNSSNGTLTTFAGSTVEYNGGAQTVEGHTYANLLLSGTGTKTLVNGMTALTGNLTLSGAVSATGVTGLTIGGNVTIGSGTTFTAGAFTHNVAGNWNNSGTFTHSNGTINFNGATQSIAAGGNDFYNMSFSNGTHSTLTSNLNLINILSVLSDNTDLNSAGFLTLVSTPSNTAVIGSLAGANRTVTGNVHVQRYIAGVGRFYRDISTPVQAPVVQQIINSGITVTGNFTGSSYPCAGCATNNASMFFYTENTAGAQNLGYQAFPLAGGNSNTSSLSVGIGYNVMVRNEVGSPTLTLTGAINSAAGSPITLPTSYTTTAGGAANDGWNFVGNPLPSTIDWDSPSGWTKSAAIQGNQISVWDPTKGTSGAYRTWNGTSGDLGSGRIAPGQGFWVKLNSAGGSLAVTEAVKTTTLGSFLREKSQERHVVEVALLGTGVEDHTYIQKTEGALGVYDRMDGPKLASPEGVNLYAVTEDNVNVAVSAVGEIITNGRVSLQITNFINGTYTLSQNSFGDFQQIGISVLDQATNVISDLNAGKSYTFSVTDNAQSRRTDRFILIFTPAPKTEDVVSEDTKQIESILAYPNPTSGQVSFSVTSQDQPLGEIISTTGVPVGGITWEYNVENKRWNGKFDMSEYSTGLYFAKIRIGNDVSNVKFVKK